jgi:prolyl-tRNA synthetase
LGWGSFYLVKNRRKVVMTKSKKRVKEITSRDEDFAQWYTDIVKKAELADYSSVKGCMIIRPYAYAMWERIQRYLDDRFKETGHENVYMQYLYRRVFFKKRRIMLKDLHQKLHGLPMVERKS